MYKFIDPNGRINPITLQPSDNMKINGRFLNEIVEGYRQLDIDGRGLVDADVDTDKVPGRDGVIIKRTQLKPREIVVSFVLSAETSKQLRERFAKLNKTLQGPLQISFADDEGWYYDAVLSSATTPPERSLIVKGKFTLLCASPYKYSELKSSSNGNISGIEALEVLPSRIVAEISKTTNNVEISNGRTRIGFKGNYDTGNRITVFYKSDEIDIRYEGRRILHELNFFTAPEEFYIRNGDTITGTNCRVVAVEWRDKQL